MYVLLPPDQSIAYVWPVQISMRVWSLLKINVKGWLVGGLHGALMKHPPSPSTQISTHETSSPTYTNIDLDMVGLDKSML